MLTWMSPSNDKNSYNNSCMILEFLQVFPLILIIDLVFYDDFTTTKYVIEEGRNEEGL